MRGVPGPHLGIGEEVGGGRRPRVASETGRYTCLASAELGLEPTSPRPHGRRPGAGLPLLPALVLTRRGC